MDDKDRSFLIDKHKDHPYFHWGVTAFLVIVASVIVARLVFQLPAFLAFGKRLAVIMSPVFYGLGIAYLLDPIVERVQNLLEPQIRRKFPRSAHTAARAAGVLLALALMVVVVWALIAMVLPGLVSSLTTIVGNLPSYYDNISSWLTGFINNNLAAFTTTAVDTVYNYIQTWLTSTLLPKIQSVVFSLSSSALGLAKALLNLIIGVIISVYLLMGKTRFLSQAKKLIYALLGSRKAGYICNVCTFANRTFGRFIGGKIVDSIIIGVLCFVGLSILKMPYTLLISIIVGVTNIIPFFGPYLGAVPSGLLLLVIDPMKCLTFVIFILILQQLDGNVIGPKILGDATGVSGFWVVVSILVFGSFWGVLGMILAVPTFAVVYQIIAEITNRLLEIRGLSSVTRDYASPDYPPKPQAEHWTSSAQRQGGSTRRLLTRIRRRSTDPPGEDGEATGDAEEQTGSPEDSADL